MLEYGQITTFDGQSNGFTAQSQVFFLYPRFIDISPVGPRTIYFKTMGNERTNKMFSHVTLGSNDISRARSFYDAVMGALGHKRFQDYEDYTSAYGKPDGTMVWVVSPLNEQPATAGNGTTVGFLAENRAAVDAFYAAAMNNGGVDEGAPGPRPHYHENYYGAYVRDHDGNKLCAACHRPE